MRSYIGILASAFLVCCGFARGLPAVAAEITPAVGASDIDAANSGAFAGTRPLGAPDINTLATLVGAPGAPGAVAAPWTTGPVPERDRYFRIDFKQAIEIGTIVTNFAGGRSAETLFQLGAGTSVAYLKADAPFPGDVGNEDEWVTLPPGTVKTLPVGTKTRAIRLMDRLIQWPWANLEGGPESSTAGMALLLKDRYYAAPGNARLTSPQRWTFYSPDAQEIDAAVALCARAGAMRLDALAADTPEFPTLAPDARWKKALDARVVRGWNIITPDAPPLSKAIRLVADGGPGNFLLATALVKLEAGRQPATLSLPPPPFKFDYAMPMDGWIAININSVATGKQVRRLVAEVTRLRGPVQEFWDLKDNNGRYVPPGNYTWSAIARPPLKLTYEGTVNNSGNPPWYAPVKGGGGWLADHSAPSSVCAVDDLVFLGDYGAEYGQPLIATDRDGNKVWATQRAPGERLAGDGQFLYAVAPGWVIRIDPKNGFAAHSVASLSYTSDIPGGTGPYGNFGPDGGAAAVFGSKMVISYRAPGPPWVASAFTDGNVDLSRSLPRPRARPQNMDARFYDDRMRFFSVFLTGSAPSSTMQTHLEGIGNGALANTITLVFNKPIPLGSVLLPDGATKVYALKPGAKPPGGAGADDAGPDAPDAGGGGGGEEDAFDPALWVPLAGTNAAGGPVVATSAAGFLTQAIRYRAAQLGFTTVFNHRFRDAAPDAQAIYGEGAAAGLGWTVSRPASKPITESSPARMALVWPAAVKLRGVTLVEPTVYGITAVDYFIAGDRDPKTALDDDSAWQQAGIIDVRDNTQNNPQSPRAANIDFGAVVTTRAVRVRVIAPSGSRVLGHPVITGPHTGGFKALVAYSPIGGDPDLLPSLNERLTEIELPAATDNTDKGRVVRHIPLPQPGYPAFDKQGNLFVASAGGILEFADGDLTAKPRQVVPTGTLQTPRGMAFDAAGLLYVADAGPKIVQVFDVATGKLVRSIGTPGGAALGPFDPTRFDNPAGIAIDSAGKLWVVDDSTQPKRISRWSTDGKLEKQFFGPAFYGGGGNIDSGNHGIVNYLGMKFEMDWATRQWKMAARLWRPGLGRSFSSPYPDRPLYYKGHRYLVADEPVSLFADNNPLVVICEERNGEAVPMVAAGNLASWTEVDRHPDLKAAFGSIDRLKQGFIWIDANGDGIPQASEVKLTSLHDFSYPTKVGDDLSLNFRGEPGAQVPLASIGPDGVPQYDLASLKLLPDLTNQAWTLSDGRSLVLGDFMLGADGKTGLWYYPDNYASVQGSNMNPTGFASRPPGFLVGELRFMGEVNIAGEDLVVTNGNHGDWYAFTSDGLLAATIFGGPVGYGRRWWSMPEAVPGVTDLTDLRLTVEDFYGSIARAEDGKVYAVAGKNHNSIVRVDGLEGMHRLSGAFSVAAADIAATQTWATERAALERSRMEPKIARLPFVDHPPVIDASLDDWPDSLFSTIYEQRDVTGKMVVQDSAALAFDNTNLYVAGRVAAQAPPLNGAEDMNRLFQTGDALDILLGTDPNAKSDREGPAPGDIRLVIARVKDEPVVMAYRWNGAAGAAGAAPITFTSPVGKEHIDGVFRVPDADVKFAFAERVGWTVEAAIPWKSLGLAPPHIGDKLRADFGVLQGDAEGLATVRRVYWANKSDFILGDLPSEARSSPALWGDLAVIEPDDSMRFGGPEAHGAGDVDIAP